MLASAIAAFLTPDIGWRGLFLVGVLPALFTLVVRAWVPESPHWLLSQGRREEARRSLAWALQVPAESLPIPVQRQAPQKTAWSELFRYPRSLAVSWMASIGAQTASYGIGLWAPTLFVLQLGVTPARAAFLFMWVKVAGIIGRVSFAFMADIFGRRNTGMLCGFGAAVCVAGAGLFHGSTLGGVSVFWLLIVIGDFFYDGGFALIGPYMAEVWPTRLRASGMGSAYGFGGIGKIIGPLGLALIVGTSNVIEPKATLAAVTPSFLYFAAWLVLCGMAFALFGFETGRRSIAAIDDELVEDAPVARGLAAEIRK
jgi:putative MFS transporter